MLFKLVMEALTGKTLSGSCATLFLLYQDILVHWVPRRSWYNGVWACTAFASFNACPDTHISWLLGWKYDSNWDFTL